MPVWRRARSPFAALATAALAATAALTACGDDTAAAPGDALPPADTLGVVDVLLPVDTAQADTLPADAAVDPDAITPGGFLAPCQGNIDCLDGFCVEGEEGFFCTRTCSETCPTGMDCKSVLTGSSDPVFLCLPRLEKLCLPCKTDFQCTGGACLTLDGAGQCAPSCTDGADCPTGYDCLPDPAAARAGQFCQPRSGSCSCTPELAGAIRTCQDANLLGTCYGVETCDPDTGWQGCTARAPAADLCDGLDNDCNGLVDDAVSDGAPCTNTVPGVGACSGTEVCLGPQGLVCTAPTPTAEACDFKDNDCDGAADEDFRDPAGAWSLDAHCGTCGNDCATKIAHGVGRCDASGAGSPVCVVDHCDPDYLAINQFQCALPPDVSCQPCLDDDDCFGGSCITLDNQKVCVSPCGGTANACADGYSCEDTGGGATRCVPITRSCVCNPLTDGKQRSCSKVAPAGTCFGVETCDATSGWTPCTAIAPSVESCDGVDNNCNGVVDDGVTPPTSPCASSVPGVGTCGGTWFCNASAGGPVSWTCSAPTPEAEVCDYRDNDCDGLVDEGVKDAATGLYLDDDHCGACGISCAGAIPNATAGCVAVAGVARCEVTSCAPGFYPAGPLTCLAVTEDLCTPCQTDANCPTPGDRCLELDGGRFCGRDCAAGNLHGAPAGACPDGYSCLPAPGGGPQCQPTSGSCGCLPADDGEARTCIRSNALGTCYGQELCDPDLGWLGCTVATPVAEVCDGVDNDCNGAIDDVPGRGGACHNTNALGSCAGVYDCPAGGGPLTCVGRTPAAETCNYVDDDCDGATDDTWADTLFDGCVAGQGQCLRYGYTQCSPGGSGTQCSVSAGPSSAEICDGFDNDCDGSTDEGPLWTAKGSPCADGQGVCQVSGVRVCAPDGQSLVCSAHAPDGEPQDVCDNRDEDCNGVVDDAWASQKGQLCSTGLGVCARFGNLVCNPAGTGVACNAAAGQGSGELCDLLDNDCDGSTDETFKVGGRYTADNACGNCFTDCEAIFAGATAGYGVCNAAPATPRCALSCCRAGDGDPACDGGDHFDLNAIPDDGCEFALDPGAIYVSESDTAAADDGSCGISPTQAGLGGHPCKHIQYGITRAQATGRSRVLVASGAYLEQVTVADGISLYGGYSALTWERDPAVQLTAIFGAGTAGHRKTLIASGITQKTTVVDGFTIHGQVASATSANSYAVYVRASNAKLSLTNNTVYGGRGGPGSAATRGGDGTNGGAGANGRNAYEPAGAYACASQCTAAGASSAGGAAGTNTACSSANGGRGGNADCPNYNESVNLCTASYTSSLQTQTTRGVAGQGAGAGAGGMGGCDSNIDPYRDDSCSCLLPQADPVNCPLGAHSAGGGNGAAGAAGAAGAKCALPTGQVAAGEWAGGTAGGGGAGAAGGDGGASSARTVPASPRRSARASVACFTRAAPTAPTRPSSRGASTSPGCARAPAPRAAPPRTASRACRPSGSKARRTSSSARPSRHRPPSTASTAPAGSPRT